MSIDDDIEDRINEYDAAFDYYLQNGEMPDNIQQDDPLGNFMVRTFEDNPQLDSQEPLWIEILKDEMMKFIAAMLDLFLPIEKRHRQEKIFISAFQDEDVEFKRKMWSNAYGIIKKTYDKLEVNVDGYVEQMKEQDTIPVLAALTKDWNNACNAKLIRDEQEIIDKNQLKFEAHFKYHGNEDFKEKVNLERIFFSYPKLGRIVEIIGREQPPKKKKEFDDTIKHYLPLLPSPPTPAAEIEEIALGNNLRYLLPIETAVMADKQTEDLFLLKYATRQLQLFANRPKEESNKKKEQKNKDKPRNEKGPIIVSLDTSGSMQGEPIKVAVSLLLQLVRMAKKQKRKCFLIEFSVHAQCLDLCGAAAWRKLDDFLDDHFTGGTNGEEMIDAALSMLKTKNYSMADVLIISDFLFPRPLEETYAKMMMERYRGTRFYGLQINSASKTYDEILDKIWDVRT